MPVWIIRPRLWLGDAWDRWVRSRRWFRRWVLRRPEPAVVMPVLRRVRPTVQPVERIDIAPIAPETFTTLFRPTARLDRTP